MTLFETFDQGKTYTDSVKPFGFMLLCSELDRSMLNGVPSRRFIAPYSADPADWQKTRWRNLHEPGEPPLVLGEDFRVNTFRQVILDYEKHPEVKSLGPDGMPCGPNTHGLLSRRTVRPTLIKGIGKESNRLEEFQQGQIDNWDDVLTEYGTTDIMSPERILFSQPGITSRLIAERINAHSAWIREQIASGKEYAAMHHGEPVTMSHKVIYDWLNGKSVNPGIEKTLAVMAARIIRPLTGVPESAVAWNGRDSDRYHTPRSLLTIWKEMGYPSPLGDGIVIEVPEIRHTGETEIRPTRLCACGCGRPVNRPNQVYYKRSCSEKIRRRKIRERAAA